LELIMGSFEKYIYSNGAWVAPTDDSPWLGFDVHDSDFATVRFHPTSGAVGLFYLGYQPRDYFEDPSASEDVDLPLEAGALSRWAQETLAVTVDTADILQLMAEEDVEEAFDVFVEETVVRLLHLLEIPVPEDLRGSEF
jgi:hypothetical protein